MNFCNLVTLLAMNSERRTIVQGISGGGSGVVVDCWEEAWSMSRCWLSGAKTVDFLFI